MLPQTVVQVLTDAALLTVAHFENGGLQPFAFGNVDTGSDDILDFLARAGQHGGGPTDQALPTGARQPIAFIIGHRASGRQLVQYGLESLGLFWSEKQFAETVALHFGEFVAGGPFASTIEPNNPSFGIEDHHQRSYRVKDGRGHIPVLFQGRFGLFEIGNVESDTVYEPGPAILAANHFGFAVEPNNAPVARDHAVSRSQGLPGKKHLGSFHAPALFVVRMDLLIP